MPPILSMSLWVSLSNDQRGRIRSTFSIPRSSHVVVNDGRIETDGTTHEDFKHLTVAKMQDYLHDDSDDFHKLFDKVVAQITEELLNPQPVVIQSHQPLTVIIEPKRRGRPAKKHV